MTTTPTLSKCVAPPAVAQRWGTKPSRVIAAIRAGKLRAIDLNHGTGKRPRFLIDPDDLAAFERSLSVDAPPPKPTRRRVDRPRIHFT